MLFKKLFISIFFAFFLFLSEGCLSQNSAVPFLHLDSLPAGGTLLDKGWKFHEGDYPGWAKPDYNDSNWQTVDLNNYSSYFPEFKKKGIGWFHLKFYMDSSLRDTPNALTISQFGSSDLYINGSMIASFGNISSHNRMEAANPHEKLFLFQRNLSADTITIAIRFASKIPSPVWLFPSREVLPISVKISPWLSAVNNYKSAFSYSRMRIGFSFVSAALGLLFILLYSFFPKGKINFLFGLFCLLLSTTALIEFQMLEGNLNMAEYGFLSFGSQLIDKACGMLLISIISLEIFNKVTLYQRILIFYILIIDSLLYVFFGNTQADFIASNMVRFLFTIELLRLGLYGFKKGNYIIAIVSISSGFRNISFLLSIYTAIDVSYSYYFFNWILCIVMITFYLATKFARNSKNLASQLAEINNLSRVNLYKEQEKQQILADRYEVLEKLVSERKSSLQALSDVRQGIALDLHDDIGSTLNIISVYSEIAGREFETNSDNAKSLLEKMGNVSRNMIDTMNDIVWAINPKNDYFENIIQRMQYFAGEILSGKNILLQFDVDENVKNIKLPMGKRKNFYLIFKEAINNSYKYSEGKTVKVSIAQQAQNIVMIITDDGTGFETANETLNGNGLKNMHARAKEIDAQLNIDSWLNKGTRIELQVPV
jgi:signal transduction histidine kinase